MSITPEAARAQAEDAAADLDRITGGSAVTGVTQRAAEAIRALLSMFPEPPTTDDREALASAIRDHAMTTQIFGKVDSHELADAIIAWMQAAGFRRPSPPTDETEWEYGYMKPTILPNSVFLIGNREMFEKYRAEIESQNPRPLRRWMKRRKARINLWEPVEAAARVGGAA